MKITELLQAKGVKLGARVATQAEAIETLVDLQVSCGSVTDRAAYRDAVLAREAEFSTAVGEGVAIPHAKTGREQAGSGGHDGAGWRGLEDA